MNNRISFLFIVILITNISKSIQFSSSNLLPIKFRLSKPPFFTSQTRRECQSSLQIPSRDNKKLRVTSPPLLSKQTDDVDDDIEGERKIDEDRPTYRSKFQRLNQLQTSSTRSRDKQDDKQLASSPQERIKYNDLQNVKGNEKKSFKPSERKPRQPKVQRSQIRYKKEPTAQDHSDADLEAYSIDSFLRGEYDRPFAEDASAPHPGLTPGQVVDSALRALRALDVPEQSHGAAVLSKFCAPLSRNDRWGGGVAGGGGGKNTWKEILRGALTPTMLARRIRASSEFSVLLDWKRLDVTEGMSVPSTTGQMLGLGSTVAFVNAALFFGDGIEPSIVQFTLRKISGVWLIDTAVISRKEWFVDKNSELGQE